MLGFIKFCNRDNVQLQVMADQTVHDHPLKDSGINEDSVDFQEEQGLNPHFGIECIECCFIYLTQFRNYKIVIGNSDQVKFGNAQNWTDCFLTGPTKPRGKHCQFKTGHDINLGRFSERPVQGGLTYQFYTNDSNPDAIAMGVPIIARLESIAIGSLKPGHVNGSKLNYYNAALLELYREKEGQNSLEGTCERMGDGDKKPVDAVKDEVDETQLEATLKNLSIK